MQRNKIAIIIPCYNEIKSIIAIYNKTLIYGRVLIIDDCSSDGTSQKLIQKKINFIRNKKNIGYESSILKGMRYVLNNWKNIKYIVTIDADGELLPKSIPILINYLKKNNLDIIVGSRNKLNRLSEIFLKLIFTSKFSIEDPISGLKIYKIKILKRIINKISSKLFLVDILIISFYYKFLIGSFTINVNKRKDIARVGNSFLVNIKILNIILHSIFSEKFNESKKFSPFN